jgi:hypothetical protein
VEELVSAGYSPRYAARRAYEGRDPEPYVRYLPKTGLHAVMHGDQAVSVHRSRRDADREVEGAREARELAEEARGAVRHGHRRRAARSSRDCVGIHTHADLSEMAQQAQAEMEHDPDPRRRRARQHHLTAAQRRAIPTSLYALPARRALPIEDPAHVRNAAARLEQMRRRGTVTPREYASALRRIRAAEARHGIGPYHHRRSR